MIIIPNVFFSLLLLCLTSTTFAMDCYVHVNGMAPPCGANMTSPCATIQSCLQSITPPNNTIYILPGQYTGLGNCDITTSWIRLIAYPDQDITPQGQVNISCDHMSRHIQLFTQGGSDEGKRSHFKGITFTNGNSRNDTANSGRGGSLLVINGSAIVNNCTFVDCMALQGGAIAVISTDPVLITNSIFIGNSASYGGGVYPSPSTDIVSCVFSNNRAGNGGAIAYTGGSVDKCNFTGNFGGTTAGAIYVNVIQSDSSYSGAIVGCIFDSNSGGSGGGIAVSQTNTNILITDCTFTRNSVLGNGGGIVIFSQYDYDITIQRCLFESNIAELGAGMSISLSAYAILSDWKDNVVIDNLARGITDSSVGGVYIHVGLQTDYRVSVGNMLVANNTPTDYYCDNTIPLICQKSDCTSLSCDACTGLCSVTENETLCFSDYENPCVHGGCIIGNSTTCVCESSWAGEFCDSHTTTPGSLITQWYFWVGIFAGILLIMFIVVTVYSKKRQDYTNIRQ